MKDTKGASWNVLSLENQLWIEVSLLIMFGLIMIYSASSILALKKFSDPSHYLKRQFFCIALGIVVMILASRIPYKRYKDHIGWMVLGTIAALFLVLMPGIGAEINNARRWFQLKFFLLQPAEYAKVVWVLYLSVSLVKKQEKIRQFKIGFLPHIVLCGIFSGLLLKEPDFGTTFIIGGLTVIMLAAGGVLCRHLFILAPIAALGIYKFVYHVPYRWERVTAFMNPWTDPLDSGYQLIQAWIAVGSGGLLGKGLGAGQQKMFYLPESYTDFILAVIGEELGFLGILAVCVLFFFLFRTGLVISRRAPDLMGTLMALGLTMLFSLQALLNMAVVLGLVPTKGLPLPFISYGGSAFTANCAAIGILMNIARSIERRMD
ncbi:putative lipid II flippase FtsW [Desulforhabdus amnigena]|jgi:cell division protein FtsW|uniref:Probable peptidoglycan glycosyltransferase FtsW n=1 Tax=Desulforhabdus amnigena TaxID=40218 RepID=A0A9W6L8R9_9BACT|nr:putative lipid II flippase FtsW [Desulforhabdus amnigena]NLJ26744.1 putative lipid II flippase FtsW [Deltaproteobacteria bacterium]GLI35998.1 putative lipid II flippase FtsW [Desulforhabdus amnigena]